MNPLPRPLYAAALQEAAASGDLSKMKALAQEAQKHVAETGDVAAAYEALKLEIAKIEGRAAKR